MNILITGFMPFGRETVNPSYEAVKRLPQELSLIHILMYNAVWIQSERR